MTEARRRSGAAEPAPERYSPPQKLAASTSDSAGSPVYGR